jgi:LmbE family N-acetylglucosaminyl deacetylase
MIDYTGKSVLAIGAHPDDIEFGCGGTMALLAKGGAVLHFAVATDGNRGSRQHQVEKAALVASRKEEQRAAATILGSNDVIFLDEEDGNLVADLAFKEKVVRLIRQIKPDMVFTHDPTWFYQIDENGKAFVNHTDHRACGSAVLDAVYPLARDLQSFPDHASEDLTPHTVPELYLFNFNRPGFLFDISDTVQTKIDSIAAHKSQIDDPQAVGERMKAMHQKQGQGHDMAYAESFIQLIFD